MSTIAPEYYEHARLRDVFVRDIAAIDAMIETFKAQRRLLYNVTSREATTKALFKLDATIANLVQLEAQLQREANEHTVALGNS